jgi:hypothetical protein
MPFKMDEIFGNFYYDHYRSLAVKFKRLIELKLSVLTKFHFILSHSKKKCFALHDYSSYPYGSLHCAREQQFSYFKLHL